MVCAPHLQHYESKLSSPSIGANSYIQACVSLNCGSGFHGPYLGTKKVFVLLLPNAILLSKTKQTLAGSFVLPWS